jgi:hypothetical protein
MNKLFFIILLILLSSCSIQNITQKAFESSGLYDTNIKILKKYKSADKDITFLGIRHLGEKTYYDTIKATVADYQGQGYIVFYEGLKDKEITDTIVLRKFRKILPIKFNMSDIYSLNYKTVLSNVLSEKIPGFKFSENIIHQPNSSFLIADKLQSSNVDVSFTDFIKTHEKLFGSIQLVDCDFIDNWIGTECYSTPHKNKNKIFVDYRDEFLVNQILKSNHQKILIIYGEAHHEGVSKSLLKKGYRPIN